MQWYMAWFSGKYIDDNNLDRNTLELDIDRELNDIYLVFATADFNQAELPTQIQLTACQNSAANPSVGSILARDAYIGSTMPMGTLSFHANTPFKVVQLVLPYQAIGCTDFLVDDIMVKAHGTSGVSDRETPCQFSLAAVPNPAHGAVTISFALPVAGKVRLVVYDLLGRLVRELVAEELQVGVHLARWNDIDASGVPTPAGTCLLQLETPAGWHVPNNEDWTQLAMHLGMSRSQAEDSGPLGDDEGGKMKTTGTI